MNKYLLMFIIMVFPSVCVLGGGYLAKHKIERACLYDNRVTINGHEFVCVHVKRPAEVAPKVRQRVAPEVGA